MSLHDNFVRIINVKISKYTLHNIYFYIGNATIIMTKFMGWDICIKKKKKMCIQAEL